MLIKLIIVQNFHILLHILSGLFEPMRNAKSNFRFLYPSVVLVSLSCWRHLVLRQLLFPTQIPSEWVCSLPSNAFDNFSPKFPLFFYSWTQPPTSCSFAQRQSATLHPTLFSSGSIYINSINKDKHPKFRFKGTSELQIEKLNSGFFCWFFHLRVILGC